ncbi:hypothetical protein ACFRCR_00445 [Oerskovia sp. NPDC056781]|uniref:hypothetical protein n=1 Tax=Oerskovia sp. NPDC056781 TaxID=3345942 RepID=UPI00367220D3
MSSHLPSPVRRVRQRLVTVLLALALLSPAGAPAAAAPPDPDPVAVDAAASEESTPGLPGPVRRVALTDTSVVVEVQSPTGPKILTSPRVPEGTPPTWSDAWGSQPLTGSLVAAEGDVVHTHDPGRGVDVLTWRADGGGKRDVPAGSRLGGSGSFVSVPAAPSGVQVQQSVSGAAVSPVLTGMPATTLVVDGTRAARLLGGFKVVSDVDPWTDTLGRGITCEAGAAATQDLGGRWLVVACPEGVYALDQADAYRPVRLAAGPAPLTDPSAAAGLVLGLERRPGAETSDLVAISILDGSRRVLGTSSLPGIDLDDSRRAAAYVDGAGTVRVVDFTQWTAAGADRTDVTAPTTTVSTDAVSTTLEVTVHLTSVDPDTDPVFLASGIDRNEVRYRSRPAGSTTFGPYVAENSGNTGTARVVTALAGSRTCFSARAVDRAGNVGAWSAERCSDVDGTAPVVKASAPATVRAVGGTGRPALTWSATDAGGIGSSDVRYRVTPRGGVPGPYQYPRDGQQTTATTFAVSAAPGDTVCFAVRVRDLAGNLSAYSSSRCSLVDGTLPTITSATVPRYFSVSAAQNPSGAVDATVPVAFSFAGADDVGVASYEVQLRRTLGRDGALSGWTSPGPSWKTTTATRVQVDLLLGDQACFRVRARDKAGNVGDWSTMVCTNVASSVQFLQAHVTSGSTGMSGPQIVASVYQGGIVARSYEVQTGRIVRLRVKTGPTAGVMAVHLGSTHLGTIDGRSATSAWKYVSLRTPGSVAVTGQLRLEPVGKGISQISEWMVIR